MAKVKSVSLSFSQNQFQKKILNWYKAEKRNLPWRKTKDPYKILVSEIMLQQTQVETVIPYYKEWMKKFGDIRKLARASIDKVLISWEGMGYYSRARNLHQTAGEIVKNYNGKIPGSYEELLCLPGIGKYTAGAVASIAFNKPVPAVDGNVKRVLSRLFCLPLSTRDKVYWELSLDLMGKASPSEFNQAMMEMGALICVSKNPRCNNCPLTPFCKAYSKGVQGRYPVVRKPKKIEEIEVVLGIIIYKKTIYIQKRPSHGLFAGLWEFPGGKVEQGENPESALHRELKEELGVKVRILGQEEKVLHNYTRFRVKLYPFLCQARRRFVPKKGVRKFLWIDNNELSDYAFPTANRKILDGLVKDNRFQTLIKNG